MHPVVFDAARPDGEERPRTDVEGDRRERDALLPERGDERLGEVESRGRRRDRSPLAGEDRLVALPVGRIGRAIDVGGSGVSPASSR